MDEKEKGRCSMERFGCEGREKRGWGGTIIVVWGGRVGIGEVQ